jgi:anhydro-N-acetylmuramic acid kinase
MTTDASTAASPVYIGLMSGTSLDGISAAAVRLSDRGDGSAIGADLVGFSSVAYTTEQRRRLEAAMSGASAEEYCRIAFDLGAWFSDAVIHLLAESGVARADVRAIGSHGQTLWHQPPHSTWQTGESAVVAERTGIDVVSDFRVRDVAAGGQGAPLVPIADALLFAGAGWRGLQNVGGMGNVTVLPPSKEMDLRAVRAFDTGPGVAVIDGVVRTLRPELPFDVDGRLAGAGSAIEAVLRQLLSDPYFRAEPPKSTGRELFGAGYVAALISRCRTESPACTAEDIVATATALTAHSIADALRRFVPEPLTELLISGGGARNPVLVEMLRDCLAATRITVAQFSDSYFDGEAKEAVAFALLAHLFLERRPGNVPTATGARGARVLGKLTPA